MSRWMAAGSCFQSRGIEMAMASAWSVLIRQCLCVAVGRWGTRRSRTSGSSCQKKNSHRIGENMAWFLFLWWSHLWFTLHRKKWRNGSIAFHRDYFIQNFSFQSRQFHFFKFLRKGRNNSLNELVFTGEWTHWRLVWCPWVVVGHNRFYGVRDGGSVKMPIAAGAAIIDRRCVCITSDK